MSLWQPDRTPDAPKAPRARPAVALPEKFRVQEGPHGMEIAWRWFTPAAFFLLFFCIAWDGFLVFWYSMAFGHNTPLIAKLFPIAHVAVGVGLTYFTASLFLNTTRIRATRDSLEIRHFPLPWPGARTLHLGSLQQLFVKHRTRTNKGSTTDYYDLVALTADSKRLDLVRNLTEVDQALFLEQKIERFAGLKDEPVAGEVAR